AFVTALTEAVEALRGEELAHSLGRVVDAHHRALTEGLQAALTRHRDVVLRVLADLDSDPARLALGPLTAGRSLLATGAQERLDRAVQSVCSPLRPRLVKLVGHRDHLVRERAVSVLAKLAPEDAGAHIRRALEDRSWRVRSRALHGLELAHRRGRVARPDLERVIRRSLAAAHWRERESAARVAGRVGYESLSQALVLRIDDPNGFVREAIAWALGRTGGPHAVAGLRKALRDDVPHVRATACVSLARLSPAGRASWLAPLIRDPSPMVRAAAQSALR
ncbi:MAG: HEAT repeat domain-containing protein, partial [Deltaproteobacteria bacterium]|nr:HEAT repeat domain-containing protein [Deltaproteobacteria bacterium]